jgi:uncharacterized integral membrane protein
MSRLVGILTAVLIVVVAMVFAALNAGNLVTVNLGFFTLYRAPVTLVAFGGLFTGMVVMFATGVHTDLKVRRILRERLAEESREEQKWIDRNQQDLFENQPELLESPGKVGAGEPLPVGSKEPSVQGSREPSLEPPKESSPELTGETRVEPSEESPPTVSTESSPPSSEESSRQALDEPTRDAEAEEISSTTAAPRSVEDEDHPMR